MRELEITDQALDQLFDQLVALPPVISEEQVNSLLYGLPKAPTVNPIKQFFINHLNLLIMCTIVSSVIISTVLWLQSPEKTTQGSVKEMQGNAISVSRTTNSENKKEPSIQHSRIEVVTKGTTIKSSESNKVSISNDTLSRQKTPDKLTLDSDNETIASQTFEFEGMDSYILRLNEAVFRKMGFVISDTGIYYCNVTHANIVSFLVTPFRSTSNQYITALKEVWQQKQGNGQNLEKTTNPFGKLALSHFEFYPCYRSSASNLTKAYSMFYDYSKGSLKEQSTIDFKSISDTLVPVTLKSDKIFMHEIFWFKPTDEFFKVLPDSIREKTRSFYQKVTTIKRKYPNAGDLVKRKVVFNSAYDNAIELSKQELSRLGFLFNGDSVEYKNKLPNRAKYLETYLHVFFGNSGYRRALYNQNQLTDKLGKFNNLKFYPVLVTNNDGDNIIWSKFEMDRNQHTEDGKSVFVSMAEVGKEYNTFNKDAGRYIVIRIKKEFLPKSADGDVYCWFPPSQALFDSLPSAIGKEISKEYKALLVLDNPKATPSEKAAAASQTTCKYFEEYRYNLPSLKTLLVYPNPATSNVTIELALEKPTEITILLYDMGGRMVKLLRAGQSYPDGQQQFDVSLSGITSGIYTLALRDKDGNMKTQRIIKQ